MTEKNGRGGAQTAGVPFVASIDIAASSSNRREQLSVLLLDIIGTMGPTFCQQDNHSKQLFLWLFFKNGIHRRLHWRMRLRFRRRTWASVKRQEKRG
ncbi:hypothetical protein FJ960_09105 [Mesorhizobium sp. B2-3-11]|uniref:hypothetical protein n=1 Tax=Mesorhizobium sp. B2-3-11 TaxID=2589953 RepID=UPI00112D7D4E|nr:hypothetical protein [Mesorhizobium sp. B2-3-11]TPM07066.1 hypothetical protein FJ960_09105 [Mesorhizobium sp. B2-3-11]